MWVVLVARENIKVMRYLLRSNFLLLLILYFSIGFTVGLDALLVALFKKLFHSSYFLANFVSFAFFSAFCVSSVLYAFAPQFKIKFLQRLNYKEVIVLFRHQYFNTTFYFWVGFLFLV